MGFALTTRSGRWMAALVVVGISAAAADRAPVREKVLFSSPDESAGAPSARPRVDLPSRPFEFLDRDSSVSGVVLPFTAPSAPSLSRNARLLEAIDQKKNWIYVRSDDANRNQTASDLFGRKDPAGADKKPKTALENFFENRGQKPPRDRARDTSTEWDRGDAKKDLRSGFNLGSRPGTNSNLRFDNPGESMRPMTAGFSLPTTLFGNPQGQGRLNELQNAGFPDSLSGSWGSQKRPDEFRKLLAVPGSVNPLVSSFDPINLQVDTTRRELNPVTAQRAGEFSGAGGDALDVLRSAGTPPGSRSSLFDQSANVLGPSSLSPAVSAPSESPASQRTPTVLEFPRRKF